MSIEFQIYDWVEDHEVLNYDEEIPDDNQVGEYIIHLFGRCIDGKSVYAKVLGYTPYFYILLPKKFQNSSSDDINKFIKSLKNYFQSNECKVYYKYKHTLKNIELVRQKKAEGFTNDAEFNFLRLIFNNYDGMKKYKSFIENNKISVSSYNPYQYKLYEANILPMIRCFHIKDISGCAWVQAPEGKYILIDTSEGNKESRCDIEINMSYKSLVPIINDGSRCNAPFKIASYDIECNSIDGEFPQANRKGDCIIQIGITYTLIGQSIPYRQYIACLKETSTFDNSTIVESYSSEEELLLGFLKEINNNDCDIITGYNIFFFDERYIYDRCKHILYIEDEMSYMSKLINYKCNFKEGKLASSAMGENLIRYWDTPGRIHIDLMKDVQKTFTLSSYKLDSVASNFIRGDITKFYIDNDDNIILECKTTNDIFINDYIHIEINKGFVSDELGDKFLVKNIIDNKLFIDKNLLLIDELNGFDPKWKLNWSQAKDDVGPKDIFRLQKGSADDRAIVAKYCIKDCKLVSLLINKLEVVTKNIEMANVCYVPLSYLFTRGQGIKLFSLCLKEFRKQKYIFPVIKLSKLYKCKSCEHEFLDKWNCPNCHSKSKEEIETETSTYEGAIVFDPVPKVEYEAIATKDYASLYPSSIIHKNMSHETMVEDNTFDNLEDITYYNANYKDSDGSIQYRRFAQLKNSDGSIKLGVIPTILDNLMKERKRIKKLLKEEKDPFKYRILDAKQNAVKITANSLYGQLGAPTSPVCKRDIAACTTSTGREMLILAKKYDEELLPWIINGLKYFYNNNHILEGRDKINKLYDLELKARNDDKLIDKIDKYIKKIDTLNFQPVIRYGDSVIGKTPLLLRNITTGKVFIKSIKELGSSWFVMVRNYNDQFKETFELDNIECWTEKGWTKVYRVIRHKLAPNKKLFRITTHSGSVVVTDDHSMLSIDGTEISPKKLKVGDMLLHSFPETSNITQRRNNITYETKYIINDIEAMEYYYYLKTNGHNVKVNYINNKYLLTPMKYDEHFIINITEHDNLQNEEYVYDLTTENHHFQAGVGSLIVHNTDSIFSCYRFRENTVLVEKEESLKIWKKIVKFGKELINPFFGIEERNIFNNIFNEYYSDDKITDLCLPKGPKVMPEPLHNETVLPINDRLKQFIKEYMEESYLPWLWTLAELVEKNYTNMFDIKLLGWAKHQLNKIRLTSEDLYENRKKYLLKPIIEYINDIGYTDKYFFPTQEMIEGLSNKLLSGFSWSDEICNSDIDFRKTLSMSKTLLSKTFRDKWIHSDGKPNKLVCDLLEQVIINYNKDDSYIRAIINIITIDMKLKNIFIANKIDEYLKNTFNKDNINYEKLDELLIIFIDKFKKNVGKKGLEEILLDFIEKELNLNINQDNINHFNKVIRFVNKNLKNDNEYYWIHPRWDFINNKKKYMIDIYKGGDSITDKRTLDYSMEMGEISGELVKSRLPFPHDLEYEKTFYPSAILTKKKYVGNKYEFDTDKFKQDFMGIVLKRRDNAPIVKEICSGIINQLINNRSPQGAIEYTKKCLIDMFNGKYHIKYFLQSRNLKMKESYKDWQKIAHAYLSNRIAERDPGNAPQSGDRIEFAVIKVDNPTGRKLLQGDIIETPTEIKNKGLEIDYQFYLTNQIMKPALQFLSLVDANAEEIFNDFIITKPIKDLVVKVKPIKDKVVKDKVIKDKVIKDKVIKDKVIKDKVVKDLVVKDKVKPIKDKVIKDKVKHVKDKVIKDKPIKDKVKVHKALELLNTKKEEQYNTNIINEFNILIEDINNKLNEISDLDFNIDRNQIDNLIATAIYYRKSKDNLFLI